MNHDITNSINAILQQIYRIMTYAITELDRIKIANTSLLRIMLMFTLISVFIPVLLSVGKDIKSVGERVRKTNK